jgi:hypothetical protein
MGGKPSKGTKKDKRLKGNKAKPAATSGSYSMPMKKMGGMK